jgi:hypothetical protein
MPAPHPGTCRTCRRPVLFVRMPSGKLAPVDPEPNTEGRIAAMRDVTGQLSGVQLKKGSNPTPGERLYMSHFATCSKPQLQPVPEVLPPNVVSMEAYRAAR